METYNVRSKVGWGQHVVWIPGDEEEGQFFPGQWGDLPLDSPLRFRQMLEAIRVPADRMRINSLGWTGEVQLIDYKRVRVEIRDAELGAASVDDFDPFESIPHIDEETREEAYLLNALGKPMGYIKPWDFRIGGDDEAPMDRIFPLKIPKLLKYILWYREAKAGNWRRRACLFTIEGNKPFEKMVRVYESKSIDPAFCQRVRDLIARRTTSLPR